MDENRAPIARRDLIKAMEFLTDTEMSYICKIPKHSESHSFEESVAALEGEELDAAVRTATNFLLQNFIR